MDPYRQLFFGKTIFHSRAFLAIFDFAIQQVFHSFTELTKFRDSKKDGQEVNRFFKPHLEKKTENKHPSLVKVGEQ